MFIINIIIGIISEIINKKNILIMVSILKLIKFINWKLIVINILYR